MGELREFLTKLPWIDLLRTHGVRALAVINGLHPECNSVADTLSTYSA